MGRIRNIRNRAPITNAHIKSLIQECVENVQTLGYSLPAELRYLECNAYRRAGLACHRDKTIVLSTFLYKEDDKAIKTVIYHELGHIIAGPLAKHGPLWKKVVQKIGKATGVNITRCYSDADCPVHAEDKKKQWKYNFRCKGCGQELHYTRKTEFVKTYNAKCGDRPRWTCTSCGNTFELIK